MVQEVVAGPMPADPIVGREADHVRNRTTAQDQGAGQDQEADPLPGQEAGVTADIS
ncbi:MAG: hypothetical protein QM644_04180 [Mobilitalea sp.]